MNTKNNEVKRENEVLTKEKLREFEGFEHFTDEEAEERIRGLRTLADIMCKCLFRPE